VKAEKKEITSAHRASHQIYVGKKEKRKTPEKNWQEKNYYEALGKNQIFVVRLQPRKGRKKKKEKEI